MMSPRALVAATWATAIVIAIAASGVSGRAAIGDIGLRPVPCSDRQWTYDDPAFDALPGAKASFGRYEGGLYRVEIPNNWNGELVLWAHGFVDNGGPQGSRLRVGFPGVGQGAPLREYLVRNGFAWAASSFRCNGYVPGVGLLDTRALGEVFIMADAGRAPTRVYLTGASMGGHITVLGLQEFPKDFAGGLAMCAAGPGEMDFLTAVAAASEFISGVRVEESTRDRDLETLSVVLGKPPAYTDKGRQLASTQIEISGGPRPFAVDGLATRFIDNVSAAASISSVRPWDLVATNADVTYSIDEALGLSSKAINSGVRRKTADAQARSGRGPYDETVPFDGRIEHPLLTMHGTGDLFVPITLERSLKQAVEKAGRQEFLVQRIMRIAGHCGFSQAEQIRAFDDLAKWVHQGSRPDGDDVLGDLSNAGLKFTEPLRTGDPGVRKP